MDIGSIKEYANFKRDAKSMLRIFLSNFFSADIEINDFPFKLEKALGISIMSSPQRTVYILNENKILLTPKIYHDTTGHTIVAYIGILVEKHGIGIKEAKHKIFNVVSDALSKLLTECYKRHFRNGLELFGDTLAKKIIANYFSKGYYNTDKSIYLINYFSGLRTTSFEGQYFSTGMILTKSDYAYSDRSKSLEMKGQALPLSNRFSLTSSSINRRKWYLVDGKKTFYVCNRKLNINKAFLLDKSTKIEAGNNLFLSETLKGADVLFKIENEKQLYIITSDGTEFCFLENHWKYRDYNNLEKIISTHTIIEYQALERLLFYLVHCSKNGISTIIWVPKFLDKLDDLIKVKNTFSKADISITDDNSTNLVLRMLSSDGAIVITNTGILKNFGVIVDMSSAKIKGVKGTGESAAGILSSNGIAIKVSQDGTIKVFYQTNRNPIQF